MVDLHLAIDDLKLDADWLDRNASTRNAISNAFPIEGPGRRWGEELYVSVDIEASPEDTAVEVEPGTIAYWPDGPAICLFWGPTPASTDETPVAASPVAPFARVRSIEPLSDVEGSATMRFDW